METITECNHNDIVVIVVMILLRLWSKYEHKKTMDNINEKK